MPNDDFIETASRIRRARLTSGDFERVIDGTRSGDFIFADPPYTVRHNLNGFIKYNEQLFSWTDQVRLRDSLFRAKSRGIVTLLSNADHESIRELYKGCESIVEASRKSVMAACSDFRKSTTELLIGV